MEGSGDLPDASAPAVSMNPAEAIANPAAPVATEDGTTGMLIHCVPGDCNAANTTSSITNTGY